MFQNFPMKIVEPSTKYQLLSDQFFKENIVGVKYLSILFGLNIYQHFGVDCRSHESQTSAEKYVFCASMDYLNSNIFPLKEYFSVQENK